MSSLTDHEVINTLDRYNLMNLGGDPTPERDVNDWIVEPLDIGDFPDARNDELMSNSDALRRDVESYQINEDRLRDVIMNATRRDLPPPTDIDALAWYLPIHYYGPEWGLPRRLDRNARRTHLGWLRHRTGSPQELRQVWQAAAFTLYLHGPSTTKWSRSQYDSKWLNYNAPTFLTSRTCTSTPEEQTINLRRSSPHTRCTGASTRPPTKTN